MFWNAYVVTALKLKGIVFFLVVFVPQFVDPSKSALLRFAVLEITFLTLAAINVVIWAVLAEQLRGTFPRPSTLAEVNKIAGSFLILAGVL